MRRRLNYQLLVGLLVATILLGGGVHLVHGYQEKRNAVALFRRADRAEREGDLVEAEKYLGRYLAYRPDDTEAMAHYGMMLTDGAGDGKERLHALLVLDRALLYAPGRDDARRRAAELALSPGLGRFKEAGEHLKILLQARPDDGALELLLGRCREDQGRAGPRDGADGDYRQARALYEKAVSHAPHQIDGYVRLAALLRGPLNDPDRADRVMDARELKDGLVARNGGSFRAYLERASYRNSHGLPGAADDVARALQLAPEEADVLVAAGEQARQQGRLDEAREHLRRGMGCHPKDVRMYRALAMIESRAARPEEGVSVLRRGLEALPTRADLQWGLADLLIQAGEWDEAGQVIARLRERDDIQGATLDYLEGRLLTGKGQWPDAIRLLERSRALMAGTPALSEATIQADLLLARGYERLGNPDQQLAASRRALALAPRWAPALLVQAAAQAALGRVDEAVETYRQAIPQAPHVRITLARLLIARNLRLPDDRRDWGEVQELVEQVEGQAPDAIEAPLLRAEFLASRNELAKASARLEEAKKKYPERVEPWISLAALAGREEPGRALVVLDEARRRLGDRVELRVARAGFWARRGGEEARQALAALSLGRDQFAPEDRLRLEDGLADAYFRLGDLREAERLWVDVAENQPEDLRVALKLFDLAQIDGAVKDRSAGLERSIARLRRLEGDDGVFWRYGEASRLILRASAGDTRPLAEARTLLAEIARRRPLWGRVPLLEARIAELEKNPDRAIDGYLKALERGERQPEAIRRAVELLNAGRRYAEADRLIQGLVEQAPLTSKLGQLAAESALRRQDQEQALKLACQAVRAGSPDYRDHLWLGQIFRATKRPPEEVEGEFRRAIAMAPGEQDAWLAWVQYLAATDQRPRAEQAIEEARRVLPLDRASLALARYFELIGARDRAEGQYRAALSARPDDAATLLAVANFLTVMVFGG